jgi:hypothetical protein
MIGMVIPVTNLEPRFSGGLRAFGKRRLPS